MPKQLTPRCYMEMWEAEEFADQNGRYEGVVSLEFAQDLERELIAALARCDQLEKQLAGSRGETGK